jgi:UDP-glucose 4-epimerase
LVHSEAVGGGHPTLAGLRCLVLGGGGFLGLNLCNALAGQGAIVQAFGRSATYPEALDHRVIWTAGMFGDGVALAKAVEGQEVIFHLISGSVPESSNREPAADLEANALATLHLLEICRSGGVKKVIFTSSGGTVYGIPTALPISENAATDPISAYGISKLAVEKYLALYRHLYNLDYHVLRIANPYGVYQSAVKKQGVVSALISRAMKGEPVEIWGTGEVTRDFIYVDDVVSALLEAYFYEGPHRIMNVGCGVGLSINQIVDDIESVLGRGALTKVYRPGRRADVPVNILDISLITRETRWRPHVGWLAGLQKTARWIAEEIDKKP